MAIDKTTGPMRRSDPADSFVAVTPSDTVPLSVVPRAIYTGAGGTIVMRGQDDLTDTTFTNVPAGVVLPVRPLYIKATSTTATGIVALY